MRYRGRRSSRIEDRRGQSGQASGTGARPGGAAVGAGGVGAMGIVIALVMAFCGGAEGFDLGTLSPQGSSATAPDTSCRQDAIGEFDGEAASSEEGVNLVGVVYDNADLFWDEVFRANGLEYCQANLVLYQGLTGTACGQGDARMGPFYCSLDQTIYIDLDFFQDPRFATQDDFAQAYVVAHEVAHHVQNRLGISERVIQERQRRPRDSNALSVAQELQADCFSGVWTNSIATEGNTSDIAGIVIDRSDIEEAIRAAESVGDDVIQAQMGGRVNPDSFTHGSAEQRIDWFLRGYESGDPEVCDTFSS